VDALHAPTGWQGENSDVSPAANAPRVAVMATCWPGTAAIAGWFCRPFGARVDVERVAESHPVRVQVDPQIADGIAVGEDRVADDRVLDRGIAHDLDPSPPS